MEKNGLKKSKIIIQAVVKAYRSGVDEFKIQALFKLNQSLFEEIIEKYATSADRQQREKNINLLNDPEYKFGNLLNGKPKFEQEEYIKAYKNESLPFEMAKYIVEHDKEADELRENWKKENKRKRRKKDNEHRKSKYKNENKKTSEKRDEFVINIPNGLGLPGRDLEEQQSIPLEQAILLVEGVKEDKGDER